ncbi:M56 family metallopeptidase [Flavilitoribacter nigricans]|uniref:Peptidase M56 domain-containing protein n=1 Tax=Flavilitoribacter nigricans (strain ATCC 23147 / DSM 23189 / NBRC 102662 / NCIMB 1420 / SS-2) TaxID=1122177 RepID=A0A2D0N2Q1_FLAN2|nr:M56 family metallopeptidase [Flavilitoribacter nigricans]PHN02801.1 hypothetical protein CRP01_29910 [Flavilitoribacter nigricans DSM 23189 = NBRC 102662]
MYLNLFQPDWAEALGWTLLHSLWQGTLIFVLTLPLLVLFKKQAPRLRYNILCLALLLLVGSMAFTFYLYLPESPATTVWLEADMAAGTEETAGALPANQQTPIDFGTEAGLSFRASVHEFIQLYSGYLVNLWLAGVCFFAFRWLGGLIYTYRLRRFGSRPADSSWQDKVHNWSAKMGIRKGVRLLESVKTEVPLILGHLKPVVLVPLGTLNGLAPEQVEAIIIHELAHIRRHDFLMNLLIAALEMVLFYHPVYWWLSNQIQQEREQCCDDIAVAVCGNARLYAQTLLLMEEKRQQKSLAMALQGKKHHLLDRIKRICIAAPASYRTDYGKAGLSLALLLAIGVASWAKMPEKPDFVPETEALTAPLETITTIESAALPQEPLTATTPDLPTLPNLPAAPAATNPGTEPSDTIPYKPNIPAMRNEPTLPAPPDFPYSLEKLESELASKSDDHEFLRGTIEKFQASLDSWQAKVKNDYLGAWQQRQDQMKAFYNDWKAKIKQQAAGDNIAEAVALKKGIKFFENSIKEHENAIKEAENVVKSDLENYIKNFENTIKDHEKKQADHDSRMEVHEDRMRVHDLRMSAHDGRMNIHDARMSVHDVRMDFHDDRMTAHDILMAAFEKEFFSALEADGLGKKSDKQLMFVATKDEVTVNGKALSGQQAQKYRTMLKKYGFEVPENGQFVFKIDENSRSIGTQNSYSTSHNE